MRTPEELIGRTIAGKFAILEHIGSGAMGEVYRARHILLESVVALKVLRPEFNADPNFKERFLREARAASRLTHQNTVRVIDFGFEKEGLTYIAMEYVEGRDLLEALSIDWPLSDTRIADILSQVLAALTVAHKAGIVHRDLKPENILIQSVVDDDGVPTDRVKVCDFGIAKVSEHSPHRRGERALTSTGTLIGTPEYMSPEQAEGRDVDARSDIYSVGIVLYQMLTRELPFEGENAINIVIQQVSHDPPRPSSRRPEVNPRLEEICLRALQKHPLHRYQSAREMRADLRAAFGWMTAAPPSVAEVSQMVSSAKFQHEEADVVFDEERSEAKPEDSATWRPPRRHVESEGLKMLDGMVGERSPRTSKFSSAPPPSGFTVSEPPAEDAPPMKRGRLVAAGASVVVLGIVVGSLVGLRARPAHTTTVQANIAPTEQSSLPPPAAEPVAPMEPATQTVSTGVVAPVTPAPMRASALSPSKPHPVHPPRLHGRSPLKAESKSDAGAPKSVTLTLPPLAPKTPKTPSVWPQIDDSPTPPPLPDPHVAPTPPSSTGNSPTL